MRSQMATEKSKVKNQKILLYDLETFPNVVYTWPGLYEVNVIKIIKDGEMASFAYKWLDKPGVTCVTREGQKSDKKLIAELHRVLSSADISIAHNGRAFDDKTSNTRMLKHRFTPPAPRHSIDTKSEAKKHFRFNGNSLAELARFLGLGGKVKTGGFDLWEACMADDAAAWAKMERYNKQDVLLLEEVFNEMRPWIKMPVSSTAPGEGCVSCGSLNLKSNGVRYTMGRSYRRMQCLDCGYWNQETTGTKIVRGLR